MQLRHVIVLTAAALGTVAATAQTFKPEDQIRYRQSVMQVTQRSLGALNGMIRGDTPYNKELAVKHAETIANLIAWSGTSFGPGTDKGAPTRADAKIWSEPDKFKALYDKHIAEAGKLPAAAAGDANTLKAQFAEVTRNCKTCHDDYRSREYRN